MGRRSRRNTRAQSPRPLPAPSITVSLACALFFGSGAIALIYQMGWLRLISLNLGSEALGITLVLSVFMGGLALGAWLGGRWADRWANPLTRYGYLELLIAVYSGASPVVFPWVMTGVLDLAIGSGWTDHLGGLTAVRFFVASALLLGPTALMGATLPILTRFYSTTRGEGGRGAGLLYGLNTVGAFLGVLAAGFVLMPKLGTSGTLSSAALFNVAIALTAIQVGRKVEARAAIPRRATPAIEGPKNDGRGPTLREVHWAVFLTGAAFMICEVGWARVMALTLGASVYAVTIVLATVLAGLGLGAAATAWWLRGSPQKTRAAFYGLALGSALAVGVSTISLQYMPELYLRLYWAWEMPSGVGPVLAGQSLICAIVMLPATMLMGGLFPVAARLCVSDADDRTARSTGRLYAFNTTGDILGAAGAGLLLIPWLGVRSTFLIAIAAQCAAAILILFRTPPGPRRVGLMLAAAAIPIALTLFTPRWDSILMTSGTYQYAGFHRKEIGHDLGRFLSRNRDLIFYRDGLTSTVAVSKHRGLGEIALLVNGKADGSTGLDMSTQRLLAHVPLMMHDDPRQVCIIGMGTGTTAGSAALYPVERVTVVEIESAVVEAARLFRDHNHNVHENPKVDIRVTDGRFFLRVHPRTFDVIISEPSNPWQVGNSDLFTEEYFRMGADALRDGGVFCQWLQTYGLSPKNIQIILRTFCTAFPHVYLAAVDDGNVVLLGSMKPRGLDLKLPRLRVAQSPAILEDLTDPRIGVKDLVDLAALIRMGPRQVVELAGSAPTHTDDLPLIVYQAPVDLYRATDELNASAIAHFADGCAPYIVVWPDDSPQKRRELLLALGEAYRHRFGPESPEAALCLRLAGRIHAP